MGYGNYRPPPCALCPLVNWASLDFVADSVTTGRVAALAYWGAALMAQSTEHCFTLYSALLHCTALHCTAALLHCTVQCILLY